MKTGAYLKNEMKNEIGVLGNLKNEMKISARNNLKNEMKISFQKWGGGHSLLPLFLFVYWYNNYYNLVTNSYIFSSICNNFVLRALNLPRLFGLGIDVWRESILDNYLASGSYRCDVFNKKSKFEVRA